MKRLIQSEFYNGYKKNDTYIEVFKNPTNKEFIDVRNNNENKSARAIITQDGEVYMWDAEVLHDEMINQNNIPDGVHIVVVGPSGKFILYLRDKDTFEVLKKTFQNSIDKLNNLEINNNSRVYIEYSFEPRGILTEDEHNIFMSLKTVNDILNIKNN